MKCSRADIHRKTHRIPEIKFEEQRLTSFAGLVVFQSLFSRIGLKQQLSGCFRHLTVNPIFGHGVVVMLLIVHLLLGYRRLQDMRYYQDDPLVRRLLGLQRLPDVSTVSRTLVSLDDRSVINLRRLSRQRVLQQLSCLGLARLTLDFDGSVVSTGRFAEGTAVGFNRKKKGQRSYYPLFCTLAQTGQVLDVHHRPGNVHDSNGAKAFMKQCFGALWQALPGARLESRIDSAFFNEDIIDEIDQAQVEFTASVPFERFPELKAMIEQRKRWRRVDEQLDYFETRWKPKSWASRYRFLFIRKRVICQRKGPLQLDLFVPRESDYEFKVIVTNKRVRARKVVAFHEGRGAQEGIFAELKSHCQMDHVPVTTRVGNQLYMFSAILAHNLTRELQMVAHPRERSTTAKRAALWAFQQLNTLRRNLIQRAGRLIRPQGNLVLSMNTNPAVEEELLYYVNILEQAP